MSEFVIDKHNYVLFDKYKLNREKSTVRYECFFDYPLKVLLRSTNMKICRCGGSLIPLAYRFDNGVVKSRTLIGRKCSQCGCNYFTTKTISQCEDAFCVEEYDDCLLNYLRTVTDRIKNIRRGEIYYADLSGIENHCGAEQTGFRPVLVIQNDITNTRSTTTIIATITSKKKKVLPTHVRLSKEIMKMDCRICLEQIKTIDKARLGKYICKVNDDIMKQVDRAINMSLGLRM